MDYETMLRANELSEILRLHAQAINRLQQFRKSYPYLIAPNILAMLEDNLRDNTTALNREMAQLQNGGRGPSGDASRFICKRCKMKFAMPLPGGICDECRSKSV